MRLIFWLSLAGISYAYAGYPGLVWMLSMLHPRRWTVSPIYPDVSIVLAVHNGIARLQRKIDHLLALDYPNLKEIIIVSDGSRDGTAELLAGQRSPRLKVILLKDHSGKAVALNAGMAEATGEIILFVDIRPEIGCGAIQQLISNFADPAVGCANGELVLRNERLNRTSGAVGGLYWRYERWIRTCESACGSPVGVYGGFYAVRRSVAAFYPPGMILDDVYQPLSVLRQGFRVVLDHKAHVYDTWPNSIKGEFQRKVRTLAGNFQLFQLAPWTLTPRNPVLFQLVSHKVLRLLVPFLVVALFASTQAMVSSSTFYAVLALLQTLTLALGIIGLRDTVPLLNRIAAPVSAMLVLNAAAVVGLYKFLFTRGPLWKIWVVPSPDTNSNKSEQATPQCRSAASPDLKVGFRNHS